MKRIVSLLLVFVMLLGVLCSCNDTDKDVNIPSDDANTPSNEEKPSDEANKPTDNNTPNRSPEYADLMFCYEDLLKKKMNGENLDDLTAADYSVSEKVFEAVCEAVSLEVPAAMGYAIKDLNNDSINELILLDYEYYVYAIFTMKDGAPLPIDTFAKINNIGAIDENGTIYKSGYSKGDTFYCSVMTLKDDGTLDGLAYGKIDYAEVFDNPPEVTYYKNLSGVRFDITKEEFDVLDEEYEHIFMDMTTVTKNAGFMFNYIFEFSPI